MPLSFLSHPGSLAEMPASTRLSTQFVCWRWDVKQALDDMGLRAAFIDAAISPAQRAAIDSRSLEIARSWYIFGGNDFTLNGEISIGNLLEYEVRHPVSFALKWLAGVRGMLARFPADHVTHDLGDSVLGSLLEEAVPGGPSAVRRLPRIGRLEDLDYSIYSTYAPSGPRKANSLRRRLWMTAQTLNRLRHPSRERPVVLWHSNQHLDAVLARWLKGNGKDFRAILTFEMNPSWRLWLHLAASRQTSLLAPLDPAARDADLSRRIAPVWAKASADPEYRRLFRWEGLEFGDALIPILSRLVQDRVPRLSAACSTRRAQFEEASPDLVVVTDDVTPYCRLAVQLAKASATPSLLVQHGMSTPGWNQDFQLADFVAFWDDKTRRDFLRSGRRDKKNSFVVGIPDSVLTGDPGKPTPRPAGRRPRIVVLTTNSPMSSGFDGFVDAELFAVAVAGAIAAAAVDCDVTFKLHPCESETAYAQILRRFAFSYEIERTTPLNAVFSKADAFIVAHTSAALEALPWAKPIIGFDALRNGVPWPLKEYYGLPVTGDAEFLVRWIRERLTGPGSGDEPTSSSKQTHSATVATFELIGKILRDIHEQNPRH